METAAVPLQNWMLQIGHACLWGSLWACAAGILCRCAPRLSAAIRAWLWWLACSQMLLCLCLTGPINLPVLPPPPHAVRSASLTTFVPLTAVARIAPPSPNADRATAGEAEAPPVPAPPAPRRPQLLFTAWTIGVAGFFLCAVRQTFLLKQLQRGTFPAPLPDIDLSALARQMGLRRAPRVLTGPYIQTPCVTGWLRPAILLPPGYGERLSAGEMRLTLAHEMAHLKRGDLLLAIVPALARALLFFHPLAWWACAEWAAAREEACDALALSATRLSRADYGRLLLKLAGPEASAPALGLSPGYHNLRRRLLGLSRAQKSPRGASLLVLALPLLLPWRLTAAVSPAEAHRSSVLPAHYSITALADSTNSEAAALNNAGQVALSVQGGDGAQGYTGSADALAALGALPKHHASLAYGINAQGQVAGTSFNVPGHGRAFLWDGTPHRLGSLPGYPYSEARGLNAAGQVAGFSETGRADQNHAWITRAFLRQPAGPITDLGTLGGSYSAAYALNALGTVVGKADTEAFGATHAFAWADGRMTDLGTLGGADSAAYAVDDQGEIAGASEVDGTKARHAFLYTGGQMRDLGTPPGMTDSAAYALNNQGQIVGTSQASMDKHATLWQNGRPTDLNALLPPHSGWTLTEARAVNEHGQIAGQGLFRGHPTAFLLTPQTR